MPKGFMGGIFMIAVFIILFTLAGALISQSWATARAADAAAIAAAGQTTSVVGVTIMAIGMVIVVVTAATAVAFLAWKVTKLQMELERRTQIPTAEALLAQNTRRRAAIATPVRNADGYQIGTQAQWERLPLEVEDSDPAPIIPAGWWPQ